MNNFTRNNQPHANNQPVQSNQYNNALDRQGLTGKSPALKETCLSNLVFLAIFICLFFIASALPAFARAHALEGKASWYGTSAHGRKTANGTVFDRDDFTAAHKTLPFGTVVRVYNLENGKNILVDITDRGPFKKGRVVDVSRKAAEAVGLLSCGVAPVVVEPVSDKAGVPLNPISAYYIRLTEPKSSRLVQRDILAIEDTMGKDLRALRVKDAGPDKYVLCLGPFMDFQEARKAKAELEPELTAFEIIEAPVLGRDFPAYQPPAQDETAKDLVSHLR